MDRLDVLSCALFVLIALGVTACGEPPAEPGPSAVEEAVAGKAAEGLAGSSEPASETGESPVPARYQTCFACHAEQVMAYARHGMAGSIGRTGEGPKGLPEPGVVVNEDSGRRYEIRVDGATAWLYGRSVDGGVRTQRLVGRIGAGVYDRSWAGVEIDPVSGRDTGRLFFTPVESVTDHGLELSPFDLYPTSPGLDMALNEGCLTCHTDSEPEELPGAQASPDRSGVYPSHHLGSDAFRHLEPLGCGACHGDLARHRALVTGQAEPREEEGLGVTPFASLPVGARRDACSRCHFQGEARFELIDGRPDRSRPLAGQIPLVVAVRQVPEFRFVGQMEQLVQAPCFQGSPEMTCATCHEPHTAVQEQGLESLESACLGCHEDLPAAHSGDRTVAQVAGRPARTEAGCVDCHMAYGQPVDLPHVITVDHRIERLLQDVPDEMPHQQFLDPDGPVTVYDDGRLAAQLQTRKGKLWRDGVLAMGLVTMSRFEEAGELFDRFPKPGTPEARRATAPEGFAALETWPSFHHLRARVLQGRGRLAEALAAYGDALALDPQLAAARMDRARLRLGMGDRAGVIEDTERVLAVYPRAEAPWNLRAQVALQMGRPDMALQAFESSAEIWPSNPAVWYALADLRRRTGDVAGAEDALARGRTLAPAGPPGPEPRPSPTVSEPVM